MVESGCEALQKEAGRFVGYVLADKEIRKNIIDKETLIEAVKKSFNSDPSLRELVNNMKESGDDPDICLGEMYDDKEIQSLIKRNSGNKLKDIKKQVRKDGYKGKKAKTEAQRRYNISIAMKKRALKEIKPKQITIADALKPIKVGGYTRKGKTVGEYRKAKSRTLSKAEFNLLKNNLDKTPSKIYQIYMDAGLQSRSRVSIKRHVQRMRKQDLEKYRHTLKAGQFMP